MTDATPRPWYWKEVSGEFRIYAKTPDGFEVQMPFDDDDARFIVRAVNTFDTAREALEIAYEIVSGQTNIDALKMGERDALADRLKAALEAMKGET